MFQSSKKFGNIKNIEVQKGYSSYHKNSHSDGPPANEKVPQPYVPHEEFDYMKIFEAGYLNCSFGIKAENAFPMKPEWQSTAEKERDLEGLPEANEPFLN